MNSPNFFCALSETLTDVAKTLVHMSLLVVGYGAIAKIPETGPGTIHNMDRLTHIDCYIDDVIKMV